MAYEELLACMDQKEVLLTRIRDLSRRIEVRCGLPDASPAEPITERQIYIDRLKKCEARVSSLLARLPAEERDRADRVLSARMRQKECASDDEKALLTYGARCRSLLLEITAFDAESLKQMKKERDRLQKLVNDSRTGRGDGLFSHYI